MASQPFVKIVPPSVRADAELLQVMSQEEEEKVVKAVYSSQEVWAHKKYRLCRVAVRGTNVYMEIA